MIIPEIERKKSIRINDRWNEEHYFDGSLEENEKTITRLISNLLKRLFIEGYFNALTKQNRQSQRVSKFDISNVVEESDINLGGLGQFRNNKAEEQSDFELPINAEESLAQGATGQNIVGTDSSLGNDKEQESIQVPNPTVGSDSDEFNQIQNDLDLDKENQLPASDASKQVKVLGEDYSGEKEGDSIEIPLNEDNESLNKNGLGVHSTESSNDGEDGVPDIKLEPIVIQEEDAEKKITKLYWINAETDEEIETTALGQKARLCFETQGYLKGETVKAKVRRNSGKKFADNSTELIFSGIVDENGKAISKEVWMNEQEMLEGTALPSAGSQDAQKDKFVCPEGGATVERNMDTTVARDKTYVDANRGNIYAGEKLFVPELPRNQQENIILERQFEISNMDITVARDKTYVAVPDIPDNLIREVKLEEKEFKLTRLRAIAIDDSGEETTRVAEAGQILYYIIDSVNKRKKKTKFTITITPNLSSAHIHEERIQWSYAGTHMSRYDGEKTFEEDLKKSMIVAVKAGLPNTDEKSVEIKRIQNYSHQVDVVPPGIKNALNILNDRINKIGAVMKKLGSNFRLEFNISFQGEESVEEDEVSRFYNTIREGGFGGSIDLVFTKFKKGLDLKIAKAEIYARPYVSLSAKGSVEFVKRNDKKEFTKRGITMGFGLNIDLEVGGEVGFDVGLVKLKGNPYGGISSWGAIKYISSSNKINFRAGIGKPYLGIRGEVLLGKYNILPSGGYRYTWENIALEFNDDINLK